MYAFKEREKILDLFEALTGARMMVNYMRLAAAAWMQHRPGWMECARW